MTGNEPIGQPAAVLLRDPRLQTRRVDLQLVAYIADKIARSIAPQRIILFGSHARGDATEGSDLDLLVIQDSHTSNRAVRRQIERLLLGRRFGVDLIVRTPEEVERNLDDGNPFYTHHVFGEGMVLYVGRKRSDRHPGESRGDGGSWCGLNAYCWAWVDVGEDARPCSVDRAVYRL